jgi:hypothetical protein
MDEYLAACKTKGRRKRKGSGQYTNADPRIRFLRQHVSRLNYGEKVPGLLSAALPLFHPTRRRFLREQGPDEASYQQAR